MAAVTAPIWYPEEEVYQICIAYFQAQPKLAGKATHPRSYLGQKARAIAQLIGALLQAQRQAYYDGIPARQVDYDGVIRSRASSEALNDWAFTFGLSSNRGTGIYGRNGATAASGGVGTVTGVAATVVPGGAVLYDSSGQVTLTLASGVTIGGGGTIAGTFNASTTGTAGNLPVGSIIRWAAPVAGCDPTVTLTGALSGGTDEESDLDLLARLLRRLRSAPRGGTPADIRAWCEEATGYSIARAYLFKHRPGIGASDVVITQAGTGQGRDPGAVVAAGVQLYVDAARVAHDTINVLRPRFGTNRDIAIRVRIQPGDPAYNYDWADGGTHMTALSYSGDELIVSAATPPTALKTAVDAGSNPRIQIGVVGYTVPIVRGVTSYADDTPALGQCTLTLDDDVPAGGLYSTRVYAASSAVVLIAQAVSDYVNGYYYTDAEGTAARYIEGIGPARQSGYADAADLWVDRVSIGGVAQAALDVYDDAGRRVANNSHDVGQSASSPGVGVTISVHAGSWTAVDHLLYDNVPGSAPELVDLRLVLVTS